MEVDEELISAYVDDNVTDEERKQVREYLAQHPVERDLAFSLMEGTNALDEDCQEQRGGSSSVSGSLFSGIGCGAMAAFASGFETGAPNADVRNNIGQRIERMVAFLKELDEED